MKQIISLLFIFIFIPAAKADALYCTEMWCQEGMTVMLEGGAWPAGEYTFDIMADDKHITCKGSLPFKTCDGSVTCDSTDITIGESGCALPPAEHSFHAIMAKTAPQRLAFTVTRPDKKAFSFDGEVTTTCGYPNGEQCDLRQCCSSVFNVPADWK